MKRYKLGEKKGNLLVKGVKRVYGENGRTKVLYDCTCDCGRDVEMTVPQMRTRKSCGCKVSLQMSIKEMNEKFMKDCALKIVYRTDIVPDNAETSCMYLCRCLCGNFRLVRRSKLKKTASCGCRIGRGEISCSPEYAYPIDSEKRNPTKGRERLRRIYSGMFKRCYDTFDVSYKNYGGRGIRVDRDRFDYENFIEDMGHIPAGMTIDRIDNNGNYSKKNCRWATVSEQARNKNNNIVYEGIIMKDWAKIMGVGYRGLKRKLQGLENKNEELGDIVETWKRNH